MCCVSVRCACSSVVVVMVPAAIRSQQPLHHRRTIPVRPVDHPSRFSQQRRPKALEMRLAELEQTLKGRGKGAYKNGPLLSVDGNGGGTMLERFINWKLTSMRAKKNWPNGSSEFNNKVPSYCPQKIKLRPSMKVSLCYAAIGKN